jgi:DNA-binding transcriptional LysR family regulator
MMMDGLTLHQLQCFEAVVSEGSFQAAAEKLLRSQPTVSASVKNLESQLQLLLLDRSGYRVTLTEGGRRSTRRRASSCRKPNACATTPRSLRWARKASSRS